MAERDTNGSGRAIPAPELAQVIELTCELTEEQKKWPVVRIVPSEMEGHALLVPVEPTTPAELLPAVGRMLSAGRAGEAADLFARLRAAGMVLKTDLGPDGVLHVTLVGV